MADALRRYCVEGVVDAAAFSFESKYGEWVRYEDAAALELRVRELEQQLMTEAERRAAFEADC